MIAAIPGIAGLPAPGKLTGANSVHSQNTGFGQLVTSAVNQLSTSQASASSAIDHAMLGTGSVTNAMVSMTQAQMTLDVATSVTTNAQNAYQTIMNMQLD